MNCPYCTNQDTKVIDSREIKNGEYTKRRRECLKCFNRFSTIESVIKLDLQVKKTNGTIQDFNIEKIKKGIIKACDKRPVTLEQIDQISNKVFRKLKYQDKQIVESEIIGDVIIKCLQELDEIAYFRFALVYKKYTSIKEFLLDTNYKIK